MQELSQYTFKNEEPSWYDRPRILVGLVLALSFLFHFSILGLLASLYTKPDYRSIWWVPTLLGILSLTLVVRLCLHLYRNHLPKSIDS
ncbi:MAG: hypothetical protein HZB23_09625 [Deltaproteobacteria bacterium]|nr:hypothetical protein [Deltaproteobacteria bacterium]